MKKAVESNKQQTLVKIIFSFLGLVALSLIIGYILRQNTFFLPFDRFFYELVDQIHNTDFINKLIFIFDYSFLPIGIHPQFYLFMIVIPCIYIGIKKPKELVWILLAFIIGTILSRIVVIIDTALVFRQRPWQVLPNHVSGTLKTVLKTWTSYPSGHTRDTLMLGLITSYFIPKTKYFMIFLALLVGFSRLYLGVHFPTDVLVGLFLGYGNFVITIKLVEYIRNKRNKPQGSR